MNTAKLMKLVVVMGCVLASYSADAQISLTVDASQNFSNLIFTQSDGQRDKNYKGKFVGAYDLGLQVAWPSGLYFESGFGVRYAGATYEYLGVQNEWDFQYINMHLGLGYRHQFESVGMYFSASPYYGYLARAHQRLNDQTMLLGQADIRNNDFGLFLKYGLNLPITEKLSANTGINYIRGLYNLEGDENGQNAINVAYGLSLGVAFKID